MKKFKLELGLMLVVFMITILISITPIFATNENIQILKKSDTEYLIYIKEHFNEIFEFALTNNTNANKEILIYQNAALDSNEEIVNYIAYVDASLYQQYFSQDTYLWARDKQGQYFIEGVKIDLNQNILEEDIELANNITKTILVDTSKTILKEEIVDDAKITKQFGKVDILDSGEFYYQLEKLPSNIQYNRFNEIAKQISNSKLENNLYNRLEVVKEFSELYNTLKPKNTSTSWIKVEDKTIIQPEETKDGEQYILWIKQVDNENIIIDAQFLTSFRQEDRELIQEQIEVKLPVTYDNPILFIILFVLVIALIIIYILKKHEKQKEN